MILFIKCGEILGRVGEKMLISNSYITSDIDLKSDVKANASNQDKIQEGTVIKGEILDLKQNEVTIKTDLGQLIKAQLANEVEAIIGQIRNFTVLKCLDNNIILEMKGIKGELMKQGVIEDALMSAGFKNTEENIKLALALLDNKMSLDKETLTKFNQLGKLLGVDNIEKSLFFIENDIKPTTKNVETFNNFLQSHVKIKEQIEDLAQNIAKLPESALKEKLIDMLINGEKTIPNELINKEVSTDNKSVLQKPLSMDTEVNNKMIEVNKDINKELIKDKVTELLKNNVVTREEVIKLIQNNIQMDKSIPLKLEEVNNVLKQVFSEDSLEDILLKKIMDTSDNKSDLKVTTKDPLENTVVKKIISKFNFDPVGKTPQQLEEFMNELKNNISLTREVLKGEAKQYESALNNINDIDDNLSFVSQIKNHIFLQVPFNINGHETNGELFIFKDKKKNKGKGSSVSALVALDTVNLGRFEVYLQKNNKDVNCQFRVKDEEVENLVVKNIQSLDRLFRQYNYNISAYSFRKLDESFTFIDREPVDTKKEQELLRYTFDLRA